MANSIAEITLPNERPQRKAGFSAPPALEAFQSVARAVFFYPRFGNIRHGGKSPPSHRKTKNSLRQAGFGFNPTTFYSVKNDDEAVTNVRFAPVHGLLVVPLPLSTTPVPLRKAARSSRATSVQLIA